MESTFHMLLYRAFHARRRYMRPCLGELGLGLGQPKLLEYLRENGPCSQRQLADYFEIDPAAVSRMLDALRKGGFVTRRADGGNRRRDLVELTERGAQAGQIWQERSQMAEHIMLRGFTQAERTQFADYLARAYRNFQAERGERGCTN